jgi:ribokinase
MPSSSGPAEVVVMGSSNTDMVVASERLPRPGETVLGGAFYQAAGGKGANQAVAAARAGARVAFIGCVGSDHFGERTRENLAREGIDLAQLFTEADTPSGVALILVDREGQNLISVAPGANTHLTADRIDAARPALEGARVLLMQLEVPFPAVERAAALAAGRGLSVLFNPAPAPNFPLPAAFLRNVRVLIANEAEIAALAPAGKAAARREEGARRLLDGGVETVIVTLGKRGGEVYGKDAAPWRFESRKVRAVDAVGAGDCFCGWVAAGLARGDPLKESIERAARAAALSVTRKGAQPSLPTRAEVS